MISLNNVSKAYGALDVVEDITFRILAGEKVGVVGPNGGGKSTIAKLILGEEETTSGSVVVENGVTIGYVPQYPDLPERCTVEEYLLGDLRPVREELSRLEVVMAETTGGDLDDALAAYSRVRERWDAADGDRLLGTSDAVLGRLGLTGVKARDVRTLSGGERNLVALARAALPHPDVLLLDEPGNHLDYRGQDLLEEFLRGYDGAVIVISHNRYLLDRVTRAILELVSGQITRYAGGYSAYRLAKLRNAAAQQASFVADQRKIERLEALVKRFEEIARARPDPKWGKRLRARRSQLEKAKELSTDEPHLETGQIDVALAGVVSRADIAIEVRKYSRMIGETELFCEASLKVGVGERVALIGPNGCGKTTFLRDLTTVGSWEHDHLRIGPSSVLGYCAQNQEVLPETERVLDALQKRFGLTAHYARDILGRYRFSGQDVEKRIGDLSGGEKNRLQFAYAELAKANLLVLDEPTNHMDIPSREVIEDALLEFDGTIIVVSHDRYLLEKVAERIVVVEEKRFVSFPGRFTEYARSDSRFWASGDREHRRLTGVRGRRRDDGIEERILALETQKRDLEQQIEAAFANGDHGTGRKTAARLERVVRRIDKLFEEWAG